MIIVRKYCASSCLKSFLIRRLSLMNTFSSTTPAKSKIKGTVIKKWVTFWQMLFKDYKDVFYESLNDVKHNPKKSGVMFFLFSGIIVCFKMNPTDDSYREAVIESSNQLLLVDTTVRNPTSEDYLKVIETYYNQGLIERVSLGLCSLIVLKNKNNNSALYRENCEYLQPTYLSIILNNILDIGFLNKWWIIEKNMIDYDINPSEWS